MSISWKKSVIFNFFFFMRHHFSTSDLKCALCSIIKYNQTKSLEEPVLSTADSRDQRQTDRQTGCQAGRVTAAAAPCWCVQSQWWRTQDWRNQSAFLVWTEANAHTGKWGEQQWSDREAVFIWDQIRTHTPTIWLCKCVCLTFIRDSTDTKVGNYDFYRIIKKKYFTWKHKSFSVF